MRLAALGFHKKLGMGEEGTLRDLLSLLNYDLLSDSGRRGVIAIICLALMSLLGYIK